MLDDSEDIAVLTFHKNIAYFAREHNPIYNKLLAFDTGIENKLYKNRYELIIKNDYFDVVELLSGKYLYGSSSSEYGLLAAKSINLKRDSNVFETFKRLPIEVESEHFRDIAPILKYIKTNTLSSSDMSSIKKFIFFGAGLGTHIIEIDKKINADIYLIIEDDIELFKLSLYSTPYYALALHCELLFSVFDTHDDFKPIADKFLNTKFYFNHYIKYFQTLNHNEEKLKEFHLRVISQSQNVFFYKDILTQYLKPIEYIQNNFKFLNLLESYANTSLDTKPVIMLAAGPSLQANIEWIKLYKDKFIIVALSSVLSILEKANITPDIVTHMDAFEASADYFKRLNSLEFLKNTLFLFSARMDEWIINHLKKEHIFFYENGTSYKQNIGNLSAACIGSTTYLILLALGVKELYLLGLNLAIDATTGSTHSSEHIFNEKLDIQSVDSHNDIMEFKKSVVKTAGNFQKEVFTNPEYLLSIDSINASSVGFKKSFQNVYNLNDGAFFYNTIPTMIESVDVNSFDTIDKMSLSNELKSAFTESCSSSMTQGELNLLRDKLNHALGLKEKVLAQQSYCFSTYNEFLGSLVLLFSRLTNETSTAGYDISLILQEYFKFIFTFIFDFFNTKELTHLNEHATRMNELLCEALLRILDEYINKLDESSAFNLS
ncbi:MAG: 6-hydroxymethylpterin diphosphokinase MptE-like protein [Sulfurimonas sp.]|jgi:hypothetical protein